jgi:hypothetical protein
MNRSFVQRAFALHGNKTLQFVKPLKERQSNNEYDAYMKIPFSLSSFDFLAREGVF